MEVAEVLVLFMELAGLAGTLGDQVMAVAVAGLAPVGSVATRLPIVMAAAAVGLVFRAV
jgi:hypothetical protein